MEEEIYDRLVNECKKLVISRNQVYGDSVDVVDIHTIVGLCMMKLNRIFKLGNSAKTKDELQDTLNYMVFALQKFEKEQECQLKKQNKK